MDPKTACTLVTVATYNERENLPRLLDSIRAALPDADVLVVDDNSPDGTGKLADEYAKRDSHIHVLHRPGKLGLGTAIIAGMRYAIEQGYDYLTNMDADFSHPPSSLPELTAGMRHHDVMIGSRYVPGGTIVGWSLRRKLMSRAINFYSRVLLGLRARDCSGGFRCYRVEKLRLIDFEQIRSRGYSFQEEILFHCRRVGCRIGETPIRFEDRRLGESKINSKEAVAALWVLFQTAIRRWRVG
jgi:dolichol-phosphate mannosyltransferase